MSDFNDLDKLIDDNLDKMDMSKKLKLKLKKEVRNLRIKKIGFIGAPIIAAAVALIFIINAFGPLKVYADNLMDGITPNKVKPVKLNSQFIDSTADFSVELFKHSYTQGENSLISPLSVYLALGMTANGADGNTLMEFENALGNQNLNELNSYYYSFSDMLTNAKDRKLYVANSIWYRDDKNLSVKNNFLQTTADYYTASAYKADFNNPRTIQDINNWVQNNTGKKIDKIIDKIDPSTRMYLINAVYFKDEWDNPICAGETHKKTFQLMDGTLKSVDFMNTNEVCFEDDNAKGFIKPYKNGKFSFAAILPNKGINIYDYVSSLSGESFMELINNKTDNDYSIAIPKFKTEYKVDLVDSLKQMGLKDCFDDQNANFSKMAIDKGGNIYIGNILHKTSISVDEQGTEAGAATGVVAMSKGFIKPDLIFDRPFLYAIIDSETKLPLFIGIMMNPTS